MARVHGWINTLWEALQHRYAPFTDPKPLGMLLSLILLPRLVSRGLELVNPGTTYTAVSVYLEPTSTFWGVGMLVAGAILIIGMAFRRTVLIAVGHVLALAVFGGYCLPLTAGVLEAGRSYSVIWTSGLLPVAGHALRLWVLQHEIRRSIYGSRR